MKKKILFYLLFMFNFACAEFDDTDTASDGTDRGSVSETIEGNTDSDTSTYADTDTDTESDTDTDSETDADSGDANTEAVSDTIMDVDNDPGVAADMPTDLGTAIDAGATTTTDTSNEWETDTIWGLSFCEALPKGIQLAFPGAEGFGRFATGGRGGTVCMVTNLNDSGRGSLRDCLYEGNRTVVFGVSGWITLQSDLKISANNLTIAGQTAPGDGIGIRGRKVIIDGEDIIVRFIRTRRGTIIDDDMDAAMAVSSRSENVIIDHCSIGFGTKENLSMPGDEAIGPRNVTLQWSIIAYALQRTNHSTGALVTASNTSIHHTIWAFNKTRNPKVRSEDERVLDFVNNLIYGWNAPDPCGEGEGWNIREHPFILGDTPEGKHFANAVGNYFISSKIATKAFVWGKTNEEGVPTYNLYFKDNLLDGNADGVLNYSQNDWSMVETATQLSYRLEAPRICADDPLTAHNRVVAGAGATVPARDEVDALLARQILDQTGILIQNEVDLPVGDRGYGVLAPGKPSYGRDGDRDRDGMPDHWEVERGLDPNNPEDRNDDDNEDGYTNLEQYLNELAQPAWELQE